MPRRAPIITEADVTRAVKAARKGGAGAVEVRPDGTIVILIAALPASSTTAASERSLDDARPIVL